MTRMIPNYLLTKKQSGFTLLEILISLSISFILILGVIQVYVNSHTSFRKSDAISRIQENGRFALEDATNLLMQAGYREDPTIDFETVFNAINPDITEEESTALGFTSNGQFISGLDGEDSSSLPRREGTDAISIRFSGNEDALIFDCFGNAVTNTSIVTNTLFIGTNDANLPALFCDNGLEQLPLVSGVEELQIIYGIDDDNDKAIDQYQVAAEVGDNWNNVISARVHIIVSSSEEGINANNSLVTDFLGTPGIDDNVNSNDDDDKRLRKQFVTTISFRNQLQ